MFDYVSLNIELANKHSSSICEIAVSEFKGGEIIYQKVWAIKPPSLKLSPRQSATHRHSAESLENEKTFAELWAEISPCFANKTVIAYFANSQISNLIATFNHYQNLPLSNPLNLKGKIMPDFNFLCVDLLLRRAFKFLPSTQMYELCKDIGFEFDPKDALPKTLACSHLLNAVLSTGSFKNPLDMLNKLSITLGERLAYRKCITLDDEKETEVTINYLPCLPRHEQFFDFDRIPWNAVLS